jgi:hypothetical protein
VTVCPDCDEPLVEVLPPKPLDNLENEFMGDQDWVEIAILTSEQYAQMVQEGLRLEGIPVVVMSKTGHFGATGQMGSFTFNPAGAGFLVLVPANRVEDAHIAAEALIGDIWTRSRVNPTRKPPLA